MTYVTREDWLEAAKPWLLALIPGHLLDREDGETDLGAGAEPAPGPRVKLSVGWPKGKGPTVVGQCFGKQTSADGETAHIFISPVRTEADEVLRTLLHELIHAVIGTEAGHRGQFAKVAGLAGFTPPYTSSDNASGGLAEKLAEIAGVLGPYPHVGMTLAPKGQKNRHLLYVCPCGVKIRRAGDLYARCLLCQGIFRREQGGGVNGPIAGPEPPVAVEEVPLTACASFTLSLLQGRPDCADALKGIGQGPRGDTQGPGEPESGLQQGPGVAVQGPAHGLGGHVRRAGNGRDATAPGDLPAQGIVGRGPRDRTWTSLSPDGDRQGGMLGKIGGLARNFLDRIGGHAVHCTLTGREE